MVRDRVRVRVYTLDSPAQRWHAACLAKFHGSSITNNSDVIDSDSTVEPASVA